MRGPAPSNGTRVEGNIIIKRNAVLEAIAVRVDGNVQYEQQSGGLKVRKVRVGGDVQAFQNTGGVVIWGNRIDGNLQCKANDPRPTGGNNVVGGNKEDQCRRL